MQNLANVERSIRQKFGKVKRSQGKKGPELIVRCPECGKWKLYINLQVGTYLCFKGCRSGHISDLLDMPDTAFQAIPAPPPQALVTSVMPGELIGLIEAGEDNPGNLYLRSRNFDPAYLDKQYGVRYCTRGRVFGGVFNTTGSLIFPFYVNGVLAGWQARLLYNPDKLTPEECGAMGFPRDEDGDYLKPPKYFTCPGLERSRALFNFDWARKSDVVVLCEGVFDAMAVGRCAVATLGKKLPEQQLQVVKSLWGVVVILLDPDAVEDIESARQKVSRSSIAIPVMLKGFKDPGDAPRDEIWAQIGAAAHKQGVDLLQYKLVI